MEHTRHLSLPVSRTLLSAGHNTSVPTVSSSLKGPFLGSSLALLSKEYSNAVFESVKYVYKSLVVTRTGSSEGVSMPR